MSPGTTYERVYLALKRQLRERAFRPGERLDPALLGDALASSVTPVRSALHTLAGERLVDTRMSDGFHVPAIDGPLLSDLYRWNGEVLRLAMRAGSRKMDQSEPPEANRSFASTFTEVGEFFSAIANLSPNLEHRRTIVSLNDRLSAPRLAEASVFEDLASELSELAAVFAAGERKGLRLQVSRYHRRREKNADAIVRTLYRNGSTP